MAGGTTTAGRQALVPAGPRLSLQPVRRGKLKDNVQGRALGPEPISALALREKRTDAGGFLAGAGRNEITRAFRSTDRGAKTSCLWDVSCRQGVRDAYQRKRGRRRPGLKVPAPALVRPRAQVRRTRDRGGQEIPRRLDRIERRITGLRRDAHEPRSRHRVRRFDQLAANACTRRIWLEVWAKSPARRLATAGGAKSGTGRLGTGRGARVSVSAPGCSLRILKGPVGTQLPRR